MVRCGVMVYGPGEGVSCSVSGTSIPLLQQYTYLDLSMTVDLDLNAIVQERNEREPNAYHVMRHS